MKRHEKAVAALRAEAQAAGVAVERVESIELGKDSVGSALGHLFGSYRPNHVLLLSLAAPDGMRWVYLQPFSLAAALPAEHHFLLRGSPTAPMNAEGPGWFARDFRLRMLLATFLGMTLIGLPLSVYLLVGFPGPAKLKGGPEAQRINASGVLKGRIFASRLGMRNFILPWVVQLFGIGANQSRMVIRAPKSCGGSRLKAPPADFAWAAAVARTAQSYLPASVGESAVAQTPAHPLGYADLVTRWEPGLHAPSTEPVPGGAAAFVAPATRAPAAQRPWLTWLALGLGACGVLLALLLVAAGIGMVVDPDTPKQVESGWAGITCSTVVCLLPSIALTVFGALRLRKR